MLISLRFKRHSPEVTMYIETPNDPQFNTYYTKPAIMDEIVWRKAFLHFCIVN
jgi:hypothetical protein